MNFIIIVLRSASDIVGWTVFRIWFEFLSQSTQLGSAQGIPQ